MSGIKLTTITAAVKAASIASGLSVRDVDAIPEGVSPRDCPLLAPRPDGLVSNFAITPQSYGSGPASGRKIDVNYAINYRLYYAPIGSGRGLFDVYDAMVSKVIEVLNFFIANDALASIEITPVVGTWGVVQDPAGGAFHGVDITLNVLDFYEV